MRLHYLIAQLHCWCVARSKMNEVLQSRKTNDRQNVCEKVSSFVAQTLQGFPQRLVSRCTWLSMRTSSVQFSSTWSVLSTEVDELAGSVESAATAPDRLVRCAAAESEAPRHERLLMVVGSVANG
jgi:hypothetical protein